MRRREVVQVRTVRRDTRETCIAPGFIGKLNQAYCTLLASFSMFMDMDTDLVA